MGSHAFVVAMSLSTVFLFSGTVFGWGAMLSMLEQENFFSDLCQEVVPGKPCDAQVAALNNAFTIASTAVSLVAFGAGWLVDNAGPTKSVVVAGVLNLIGYIGVALSKENEGMFTPALTAAAVGGSLTMFIGYQVPFLIPSKFALLIAINSCLFDAGTLNFPILKVLYGAGLGFTTLFWLYAVVAMIMFPLFAVAWGMNEAEMKQIMAAGGGDDDAAPTDALTSKPLTEQMKTFEFFCIFIYSVIQVPRSNLYMGTVPLVNGKIAEASGASDSTLDMVNVLTEFIIPFGFLAVPPIEMSIHKMGIINTVQLTTLIGILYNAIQLIPSLGFQLVGTVVFAIWRAFLFSIISAYNGDTFGVRTMGRIMGIGFFASGIANISLDPVVAASVDMGTFVPMLVGFLVVCLPLPPLFLCLKAKMNKTESAREPLRGPSMQRTRSLALASRGGSLALSRATSLEAAGMQTASQELRMA
eukprot:TRINITY_DN2244_c0_g1_i5.p1 TRINITY_DN2244_c0_g1~~TRINITY_DN2244_c0_g1_i5.p1  ORF type:complete len:471 (+),score=95.14 TRINITY_DN2244_c0_g1_i5:77-1489(+)